MELVTHSKSADTYCRFCGAPALISQDYSNLITPELIIPFEIDKPRAGRIFAQHLSARPLTSSVLSHKAKSGNFNAIYIPVCLKDIELQTDISASSCSATVTTAASDICSTMSSLVSPELFSLLGSFDFSKATRYTDSGNDTPYEKYANTDEQDGETIEELKVQAIEKAKESFAQDMPVKFDSCTHKVTHSRTRYALVPLWILSHHDKGYSQQLFINGQSGKIIGEIPPSIPRMAAIFGIIAAGCAAIGELIWMAVN